MLGAYIKTYIRNRQSMDVGKSQQNKLPEAEYFTIDFKKTHQEKLEEFKKSKVRYDSAILNKIGAPKKELKIRIEEPAVK